MDSSQDTPLSEEDKARFKVLNAIYGNSKGYKFASIPFSTIYTKLLAWDEKEQQLVRESYDYLRKAGLLDSKSLGNVSITHEGKKEFEDVILRPNEGTTNFPPCISKTLSEECRELKKKK